MHEAKRSSTGSGRPKATTDLDLVAMRRIVVAKRPNHETLRALCERLSRRPQVPPIPDLIEKGRRILAALPCTEADLMVGFDGDYECGVHGSAGAPGCRLQPAAT